MNLVPEQILKSMIFALLFCWTVVLAEEPDASCHKGWCVIREPVLRQLLAGIQKMAEQTNELRQLCGWQDK